jgi:ribA/ribD-fused uncharacterized protein
MIESFSGEYRWLSNFWPVKIHWLGRSWESLEHAYQASKAVDPEDIEIIAQQETPGRAKRAGAKLIIRDDWEYVRVEVMSQLLVRKFAHPELQELLLATGDQEIQEGNNWNDRFWGVCDGEGENILGKLLMGLRRSLREDE